MEAWNVAGYILRKVANRLRSHRQQSCASQSSEQDACPSGPQQALPVQHGASKKAQPAATTAAAPRAATRRGRVSLRTDYSTLFKRKTSTAGQVRLQPHQQDARLARRLAGRVISKTFTNPLTGRTEQYLGKLVFLGPSTTGYQLQAVFEDTDVEDLTVAEAKAMLMPLGTQMPAARCGTSVTLQQLPAEWDLCSCSALWTAMQLLMPGEWCKAHCTKLAGELEQARRLSARFPNKLECVETTAEEVQHLMAYLPLTWARHVLEPFNGRGNITQALLQHGCRKVATNDLCKHRQADMHQDALQPGFFARAAQTLQGGEAVDVIVTSPWFTVVDIAVPLMVASGAKVVAVHVAGTYLNTAGKPRLAYLSALRRQGRVAVLAGLPKGKKGMPCMWLLVFRDRALREQLVVEPEGAGGLLL